MNSSIIRIPETPSPAHYGPRKDAIQGRLVRMTRAGRDLKRTTESQVRGATIRTVVYREMRRQGL